MERKDVVRGVLDAAEQFIGRKLWKRFTNYDFFGVRVAGRDELILAGVLGDAGEEYGLSLFRGPRAAASIGSLLEPDGAGDDAKEEMDMLGFRTEAFGNLPPDAQAMLREPGLATETPASSPADQHPPQAPIPIEEIPAKPKVPRHTPCPCGRGRRYKKCCGRQS